MFKLRNLFTNRSLSAKFALGFSAIVLCIHIIMLSLIIPSWQAERLKSETDTINRLLANMENQVLLTIHVNSLYNASYWEKMNLEMKNRLHELFNAWNKEPQKNEATLITHINEHLLDFTCNALLMKHHHSVYGTKGLLEENSPFFSTLFPSYEQWSIYDKTQRLNICPTTNKEYLFLKKIPQSPYEIALLCKTKEFLHSRSDFEISIGSMLKQSFQTIKNHSTGFAYMMWVDGSERKCDHNATYRKSFDENAKYFNTTCCVSESSPTDQPLTGELKTSEYLHAAKEGKPIHHLLPKADDPSGKLYQALTWVRYFKGSREYPLLLAATLYEEEIYSDLEPIIVKFVPAILLALGVAFALGWLLFRGFTCKIDRLLNVAKTIKSGNLKERSHLKGDDDISLLAQTFDTMLDGLEENIHTLDTKVHQRTYELENLLQEKEVLLKEVHHRVKNNLSIIIALMQLKENKAKHHESKQLLMDLQERIYAIELLHRHLYQSSSLTHIAFDTYVQGLIENMRQTYATDEKNIVLHVKSEAIFLSIEHALSCGLLINECVTNAIKHAFTHTGGCIDIAFTCKETRCILSIRDNGKGLGEAFSLQGHSTLGMRLMEGIIFQQLQGTFHYESFNGSHFEISFYNELPLKEEKHT
ncbi:histidine kinase dimerization/phosphoacceptor domain -containing protein [Sulfurospirillum barnesii]|uniref:histidine kinase n=1 Tax=Sulfurospirillum barnesii (strain ATCC 700032 / DSM 10660 / SES-3) TaxID=760154 RepID=I3XY76_SULBS|nr:histidine kinase dimerization/phosphoacceptor domain -containing protein [Sulfurospirillum barnesii]AFL68900.1 signal transduction histidine kinase [Sulfurospirillum barnesii SES-3]